MSERRKLFCEFTKNRRAGYVKTDEGLFLQQRAAQSHCFFEIIVEEKVTNV